MKQSHKILIGVALDGNGGVDSFIYKFVTVANNSSFKCDVLTTKFNSNFESKLKSLNARLINIGSLHDRKNIYTTIKKLCNENNYEAAYWNISTALMYPYIKATEDNKININIVQSHAASTDVNNKLANKFQRYYHFVNRRKINKLDIQKAAVSEISANWMFGKNSSFTFVPEPVNTEDCIYNKNTRYKYREELNLNDDFVVGCVTSFLPIKNPLFIIDVMQELQKLNNNAKLVICGDGPLKNELNDLAKEKLLSESYQLLGYRDDANKILSMFDAFIFPSKIEGLGMALIEAQASGLPCVYSNNLPKEVSVIANLTHRMNHFKAESWAYELNNIAKNKINRSAESAKIMKHAGFTPDSPQVIIDLINKLS